MFITSFQNIGVSIVGVTFARVKSLDFHANHTAIALWLTNRNCRSLCDAIWIWCSPRDHPFKRFVQTFTFVVTSVLPLNFYLFPLIPSFYLGYLFVSACFLVAEKRCLAKAFHFKSPVVGIVHCNQSSILNHM